MDIREQIITTLLQAEESLMKMHEEWCIIGAAAMILHGMSIGSTSDIDILTTDRGAAELQKSMKVWRENCPVTKEDNLFRSNFARFKFPLMDMEVMGNLQINKEGRWREVRVTDFEELRIGRMVVKLPTLNELKNILRLFGRDKDLRRLRLLEEQTD